MREKLNQFIQNTQGQFIEVSSNSALYQCMDLSYLWVFCLGFPKATIQNQYAYQVFKNPKAITKEYFDLIPNTPSFIPQDGDIGVFDATKGNVAGHIGICLGGGNTSSFPFFEQNSPVGSHAHVTPNKTYTNFLGVLRPKVQEAHLLVTDQTRIPQIENREVQSIRSSLLAQEEKILSQSKEITQLRKQYQILDEQYKEALERITELNRPTSPVVVVEQVETPPTTGSQASGQNETITKHGPFTQLGMAIDRKLGWDG